MALMPRMNESRRRGDFESVSIFCLTLRVGPLAACRTPSPMRPIARAVAADNEPRISERRFNTLMQYSMIRLQDEVEDANDYAGLQSLGGLVKIYYTTIRILAIKF